MDHDDTINENEYSEKSLARELSETAAVAAVSVLVTFGVTLAIGYTTKKIEQFKARKTHQKK